MKKLSFILLGILIIVQIAVPFSMIRSRENILRNGELFKFKTRPIDPADPFQGRYVRLGFEDDFIAYPKDRKPNLDYNEPVYVVLETDEDGFAKLVSWSREKPAGDPFLLTRYIGMRGDWNNETKKRVHKGLRFDLPFDRFYMDEAKAPRAEQLAREATRTTNCWVDVRILNGEAIIEDVFAEGVSLRELAQKKVAE